jgi:hypothetical protein
MNINKISKEMESDGLKEIVKGLGSVITRIKTKKIPLKQGFAEITGYKHIIQAVALDCMYFKLENTARERVGRVAIGDRQRRLALV